MGSSTHEDLVIEIGANIDGYKQDIDRIEKLTKDLIKTIGKEQLTVAKQIAARKIKIEKEVSAAHVKQWERDLKKYSKIWKAAHAEDRKRTRATADAHSRVWK
ncbi:MAG: hypothetical protein DRG30_06130, partial [Epsilonproteobacteria bacterium]